MKKFKWIVEITVDKIWVEDGFDMTDAQCERMMGRLLPYASSYEMKARVLSSPPAINIAKTQGYTNVAQWKKANKKQGIKSYAK